MDKSKANKNITDLINNDLYKIAFNNSERALMLLTTKIVDCNAAMLKLIGTSREQIIGMEPWDIIGEYDDTKQSARSMLKAVFQNKQVVKEIDFVNFENKKIPIRIVLTLIQYKKHKMLLAEWSDLTEQKKFEERAKKAQQESMMANHEVILSNLELERQKEEIVEQKDIIETKNKAITASINYAGRIQSAVYTPPEDVQRILPDNFIIFRPFNIVSGDFYWIQQIENVIVVAAADCTGHGIPGAVLSMLALSLLREVTNSFKNINKMKASDVLNRLREKVKTSLRQTGKLEERKDGLDISLILIDLLHKKAQYAGAYNPLWMLRDNEFVQYKADPMPIAIFPREKPFTNNEIELKNNDRFYLFSDGYQDQFGGPTKQKKFGKRMLRHSIIEHHNKPFDEQKRIFDEKLDSWMDDQTQTDDILLIGFKIDFGKMKYKSSSEDTDWSNYKLLVAEDDDFSYFVIESTLSLTNISIKRANNGKEAIEYLKNNKIDILITDLTMPVMDGYELIRETKKLDNSIKIIVQTAYITEDKKLAFDAGCDDYIKKPINHKELLVTIDKYLH